ncbi:MAG: hypothetical protein R6T99_08425 [Bacteroidales bacterium]
MKKIFILLILLIPAAMVSQKPGLLRLELNARMSEDTYEAIPCGSDGVLIFYEGQEGNDNVQNWHFALFDNQFREVWTTAKPLIAGMAYEAYSTEDGILCLLFYLNGKSREEEPNMQIVEIVLEQGTFNIVSLSLEDKGEIAGFLTQNDHAVVGMNFKRYESRLYFVNLLSGDVSAKIPDLEGQQWIERLTLDTTNFFVYAVLQKVDSRELAGLYLQKFNLKGNSFGMLEINPVIDQKYLNNASVVPMGRDVYTLGTYNYYKNRAGSNDESTYPKSTGFYMAKFANEKQIFIHYYNFLEFRNLIHSFSAEDIIRIRKRAEKQQSKEGESSLDYSVVVHPVIYHKGAFIMLAEAFYPEYHTVTNMYYDYYGRAVPQSHTVFDGYKFFSGIVASFDAEGEIQWDNSLEIRNILTSDLQKHLEIHPYRGEIAVIYNRNGRLHYKVFDRAGGHAFSEAEDTELGLKHGKDRLMDDARSKVVHWYDHFFLVYGYQELRNNALPGNRRSVFYLNKIAFQ